MTVPSLCLNFRALGRPFLWAAYFFRPSVPRGRRNECSHLPQSSSSSRFLGRSRRVLHLEPVGLRAARQTSCPTTTSQCPLCCITAAVASITASSPLSMERVATHASKKIRGSLLITDFCDMG